MALIQKLGHGLPAHNSTSVYLDYLSIIACPAVILLVFDPANAYLTLKNR